MILSRRDIFSRKITSLLGALVLCANLIAAFLWPINTLPSFRHSNSSTQSSTKTTLFSGKGIAKDYSWREEAFEIEISVQVPPGTKAKDIHFKAKSNSIDLKLNRPGEEEDIVLLDASRNLRGRVVIDGTYWEISDAENDHGSNEGGRQVTVTIEKLIRQAKDDFDVVDYDWNGVYREEEEGEVNFRKYDEPEALDVREYAASLGVDIDNINMSLVDKTMFSSGLNLTKNSYDSLQQSGLMQEVTQQSDGTEWITDTDGDRAPFSTMGKGVSQEEIQQSSGAPEQNENTAAIPFLDTDSPWHKSVPVEDKPDVDTRSAKQKKEKKDQLQAQREKDASDPIGTLTVAKLREILRSRGLKVSGNKKELQDRLRGEVNSMLRGDSSDA
jgi:hypothetical protein